MKQVGRQINPIPPRANAKLVSVGSRRFLVGGMTVDKITNDIYQIRSVQEDGNIRIQYKPLKFKNNVFKPRNSFSACGTNNKIYIWGGLQSKQIQQICLHELIEVDVEKYQMRLLPVKQPIKNHSAALLYNQQQNQLIAIGGTNQTSTILKLQTTQQNYEWKKSRLDCQFHKGYLWQHTAHLSHHSYFNTQPGKFLTVIGGCHYPQSPYNSIVQFDLKTMKMSNSIKIKYGLVSHDSTASKNSIVIFGGVTGGDFNNNKIVLEKGQLKYQKGHNAVGCVCFEDQKAYYVLGGVSGPETLNTVQIYKKEG